MFIQFMHCGRIAHPLKLPAGAHVLEPSAVAAAGEMYTDAEGMQPFPVPQSMTGEDIKAACHAGNIPQVIQAYADSLGRL